MTTQVHFVGSVPLTDAEDVLRSIYAAIGAADSRQHRADLAIHRDAAAELDKASAVR